MPFDEQENPIPDDGESHRPEQRGFAPDQMVKCETCLRVNPPTRTNCLYCGAALPAADASAALRRPTLRKLEKWEQGFNVILLPDESSSQLAAEERRAAAEFLRLKDESLKQITDAQTPLPLACTSTIEEASLIETRLGELGLKTLTVSDADLSLSHQPPRRVNAVGLTDATLGAYSSGDGRAQVIAWDEISLMVEGRMFQRQIEVEERRGRGAENEMLDAREMNTDEVVLDIYARNVQGSLRIVSQSFDFSCLGPRKSLVAAQNFQTLVGILRERAIKAVYDDAYNRLRYALSIAWPIEQQTESRGWRRVSFGRVSTEAVTRSDNEAQFTRYSRLLHYLSQHQPGARE